MVVWWWRHTHDHARGQWQVWGQKVETKWRGSISCAHSEMAMQGNSRSWLGGADVVVVMGVHTQIMRAGGSGFGANR